MPGAQHNIAQQSHALLSQYKIVKCFDGMVRQNSRTRYQVYTFIDPFTCHTPPYVRARCFGIGVLGCTTSVKQGKRQPSTLATRQLKVSVFPSIARNGTSQLSYSYMTALVWCCTSMYIHDMLAICIMKTNLHFSLGSTGMGWAYMIFGQNKKCSARQCRAINVRVQSAQSSLPTTTNIQKHRRASWLVALLVELSIAVQSICTASHSISGQSTAAAFVAVLCLVYPNETEK